MARHRGFVMPALCLWMFVLFALLYTGKVQADCWLIEGDQGFVWLAICSQNLPPYVSIPTEIDSTVRDLRLNENRIMSVHYSSLCRFVNLTYLNLTKNEVSYIEDGAFAGQSNLQMLQLGHNRLRSLTEGILRGLGMLEFLYLQANLIETVTPNAFWDCPNIINIDLSMNRIQRLDSNTFVGLSKLTVCELYSNPFYCSCELLGFLKWLDIFTNMTRTFDRMQCDSPPDYTGYFLVGQGRSSYHNALGMLSSLCTDGSYTMMPYLMSPKYQATTGPPESPCSDEDCFSGDGTTPLIIVYTPPANSKVSLSVNLNTETHSDAVLVAEIPYPYSNMYILVQYNNSFITDIRNLKAEKESIKLDGLKPNTNYTYCVASIRNSLRFNHTCIAFYTRSHTKQEHVPTPSTATHYIMTIMTILGCLFGMVIILGIIYYCLRKKRQKEEKHNKAGGSMKKRIIELKYDPEMETHSISQLSQGQMMGPESMSRILYLPSVGEVEQYKLIETSETPKATKGNYMEV
ncbi:protein ELFN1-like [Eleutherodactylus coqui]|uniref:protein ELFN1-like n=1 Tax=Eleutherodactylus coqui TaxID=57060 RepID=UPI0034631D11